MLSGETSGVSDPKTVARGESGATVETTRGPVVVVDADRATRRVVRLVLEGAGWRCFTAPDIGTAEKLVAEHHPKLLISEVRLENMETGMDLARKVASKGGWRPRIALMSAYPRPQGGYEDYFLRKPLEFDELLHILEGIEAEPGW